MRIKNRIMTMLGIIAAALFLFGIAAAAGTYGTSTDPLVTLSYITDVFKPELEAEINQKLEEKAGEIKTDLEDRVTAIEGAFSGSSQSYTVIELKAGQTITGGKGCELMLRMGSAYCIAPASPGIIDTTSGSVLENGGRLEYNHMYMVTIDVRAVTAIENSMLIARGNYTID